VLLKYTEFWPPKENYSVLVGICHALFIPGIAMGSNFAMALAKLLQLKMEDKFW